MSDEQITALRAELADLEDQLREVGRRIDELRGGDDG